MRATIDVGDMTVQMFWKFKALWSTARNESVHTVKVLYTHTHTDTSAPAQPGIGKVSTFRVDSPLQSSTSKEAVSKHPVLWSVRCPRSIVDPHLQPLLNASLKKKLRKNRKRKTKKTVRIKHLTIQLLRGKGWKNVESEFPYGSVFCGLSSLCLLRINMLIFILSFST